MVTNLEALKSQSIVGVIERYIPLRKNGANFIACCPFHSEKSPSFVVSEAKGMFKCFGCGKGGDALSFIKEYEKIDFNEAVKRLSELTGIALEYDKAQRVGKSPSEVLEKINELAKRELVKNAAIVEYLAQRGLTQEICEKYDIGLVPSKQILLANFSTQELVESGFANKASGDYGLPRGASTARNDDKKVDSNKNEQSNISSQAAGGRIFDEKAGLRSGEQGDKTGASIDAVSHKLPALSQKANAITIPMHHRICIAIRNPQHKIVAFVARTHPHYNFPPNAPKYINSKESYFYKKTQILYLYSNAKSSIQAQKAAFVVEGYIDSILLHENGFKNALATGGTAFNVQHLNLLTRLDCEVIFCFDNDKSGMAANFRAVKVCFNAGFYRVKVAILQNRDTKGRLCKDINEALMTKDSALGNHSSDSKDFGTTADHQSSSAPKSLESTTSNTANLRILEKEKRTTLESSSRAAQSGVAIHKKADSNDEAPNLNETAKDSRICDEKSLLCEQAQGSYLSGNDRRACEAIKDLSRKAESTSEKLKFNYLSGYEFFIKWLYKNNDKQQAFNEIKAAISACQNFYDKQEFLDTACKLTGVPSEYFTQDKIPTKQPKDDYSTLIASILHNEECAYIASELDLSFIPQHKQLQAFLQTGENKELAEFIEVEPLDSDSFYQHYCDLYLAHLSREQTKARAKKDLKLVLALSEKIAQVQQDIQAQKAF